MSRTSRVLAAVGVLAVGIVAALAFGGVFSASAAPGATTTAATTTTTSSSTTTAASGSVNPNDKNLYPFGAPQGGPAVTTPPPAGEPTLAPVYATKTTTRLYGTNPFEEAVSVTQHIWPSVVPLNDPTGRGA